MSLFLNPTAWTTRSIFNTKLAQPTRSVGAGISGHLLAFEQLKSQKIETMNGVKVRHQTFMWCTVSPVCIMSEYGTAIRLQQCSLCAALPLVWRATIRVLHFYLCAARPCVCCTTMSVFTLCRTILRVYSLAIYSLSFVICNALSPYFFPPQVVSIPHIWPIYIPPNYTSIVQPLDQGIMYVVKAKYRKGVPQLAPCHHPPWSIIHWRVTPSQTQPKGGNFFSRWNLGTSTCGAHSLIMEACRHLSC